MHLLLFHDIRIPPFLAYAIGAIVIAGPILAIIGLVKVLRRVIDRRTVRNSLIAFGIAIVLAGAYFFYFLAPRSFSDYGWDGLLYLPAFPFGAGVAIVLEVGIPVPYLGVPAGTACNFLAFFAIMSFLSRRNKALE